MRRRRALVLKVAALQVGRREVLQVELQVVQPGVALLAVQPVPVRQAQLEPRVLLEQREPQARLLVRSPGLSVLWVWSAR